jgi:hypothetical protein
MKPDYGPRNARDRPSEMVRLASAASDFISIFQGESRGVVASFRARQFAALLDLIRCRGQLPHQAADSRRWNLLPVASA